MKTRTLLPTLKSAYKFGSREALLELLEDLKRLPNNSQEDKLKIYTNLYFVFLRLGDFKEAAKIFEKIRQIDVTIFRRIDEHSLVYQGNAVVSEEFKEDLTDLIFEATAGHPPPSPLKPRIFFL